MNESYLPFFRKYRPQSFKDIIGQEGLVKTLTSAIELNRIAHAYLFCGPRGTGKTSSARILAKSLNCANAPTLEPCQKCPSCLDITNANGVDVIEIDAATNRGIDDAKILIEQTQYAAMSGKYKIFIIDEVHMLTTPAFNALLKTLEEPPKNVIFILATTEPHKVLETIVSRCQRFDFRRITSDDIVGKLREISNLEKIKITDEALYTIANNVSGGLRDSLALLDQVSIFGLQNEITKDVIENLIGKITFDTLLNLVKDISSFNISKSFSDIEEIYKKGNEPRNLTENLVEFLRNAMIVMDDSESALKFINLNAYEAQEIKNAKLQKSLLAKFLSKILEFYPEVKNAANPYLWVELMVLQLCNINEEALKPQAQEPFIKPEIETPKKSEAKIIEKPKPVEEPKTVEETKSAQAPKAEILEAEVPKIEIPKPEAPKTEAAQIKVSNIETQKEETPKIEEQKEETPQDGLSTSAQEAWSRIVNSIETIPARCFFSGVAKLVDMDETSITLGFLNQNLLSQAKSDLKAKPLDSAIKNVFENGLNVHCIQITKDTPVFEAKVQAASSNTPKTYSKPTVEQVESNEFTDEQEPKQEEKQVFSRVYTAKTKEMVESFSGKVID